MQDKPAAIVTENTFADMGDDWGTPANPVIGVPLHEDFEWQILGRWIDLHKPDTLPQTDPAICELEGEATKEPLSE